MNFHDTIPRLLDALQDDDSHTEYDPWTIHPSQAAKCPRQAYLSKLGLLDHSDHHGTFQVGNLFHAFLEDHADRLVDLNAGRTNQLQFERDVSVRVDDVHFVGTYDCYDPHENALYDFKTHANFRYLNRPVERHLDQLTVYMHALEVPNAKLVYLQKKDFEVATHPEQDADNEYVAFDPERLDDVVDRARRVCEAVADYGIPLDEASIPFEKCGCFMCESESLDLPDVETVDQLLAGDSDLPVTASEPSV
jgi:hypothetical protein